MPKWTESGSISDMPARFFTVSRQSTEKAKKVMRCVGSNEWETKVYFCNGTKMIKIETPPPDAGSSRIWV